MGHVFRTHGDTEVVLAAYQQWGEGCFDRLDGMWGLAILDLRRDAATSAALRALASQDVTMAVFTDAPSELARTALAQLGATRRVSALETGAGALERLLVEVGGDAEVVRTRADLLTRA